MLYIHTYINGPLKCCAHKSVGGKSHHPHVFCTARNYLNAKSFSTPWNRRYQSLYLLNALHLENLRFFFFVQLVSLELQIFSLNLNALLVRISKLKQGMSYFKASIWCDQFDRTKQLKGLVNSSRKDWVFEILLYVRRKTNVRKNTKQQRHSIVGSTC